MVNENLSNSNSIQAFAAKIAKNLEEKGLIATPTERIKINGVVKHGLIVKEDPDETVSPVFPIDYYLQRVDAGKMSINDVMDIILKSIQEKQKPKFNIMDEINSEKLVDKLELRLVNYEKNRNLINEQHLVAHKIKGTGLVGLFYVNVFADDEETGSFALTDELFKEYSQFLPQYPSSKKLFEAIIHRSPEKADVNLTPLSSFLANYTEMIQAPMSQATDMLYVMSNSRRSWGASAILFDAAKPLIKEVFPEGMVTVIPSSLHEVLILEKKEDENVEMIQTMIHDVNKDVVGDEFLSDDCFHYDANTGVLSVAE